MPSLLKKPSNGLAGRVSVWTTLPEARSAVPSLSPIQKAIWVADWLKRPPCAPLSQHRSAGFKGLETSRTPRTLEFAYSNRARPWVAVTGLSQLSWDGKSAAVGDAGSVGAAETV